MKSTPVLKKDRSSSPTFAIPRLSLASLAFLHSRGTYASLQRSGLPVFRCVGGFLTGESRNMSGTYLSTSSGNELILVNLNCCFVHVICSL